MLDAILCTIRSPILRPACIDGSSICKEIFMCWYTWWIILREFVFVSRRDRSHWSKKYCLISLQQLIHIILWNFDLLPTIPSLWITFPPLSIAGFHAPPFRYLSDLSFPSLGTMSWIPPYNVMVWVLRLLLAVVWASCVHLLSMGNRVHRKRRLEEMVGQVPLIEREKTLPQS
jgi:hypothetical protein